MAKTDWTSNDTVKPADMNEIGQEINQLREDVDNIHIPPATLTEAGIVQLSSATDSTSETMAATPNAVKTVSDTVKTFANDTFIKKSVLLPDGTDMNNLMDEGEYYCPANSIVATFKNAPDGQACHVKVYRHAGVNQMWYVFNPNDNRIFTRNYYPQIGWGAWRQLIDDTAPWQKTKLTADDGKCILLPSGTNLNTVVKNGFYNGSGLQNAPNSTDWWYIEVLEHTNGDAYAIQKAYSFYSLSFYMRIMQGGAWSAWSPDLFTSVANGKSGIARAISDMGVYTAPDAAFATMEANIRQISTGSRMDYSKSDENFRNGIAYTDIITIPAGKIFTFIANGGEATYAYSYTGSFSSNNESVSVSLCIRKQDGSENAGMIGSYSTSGGGGNWTYYQVVEIDLVNYRWRCSYSTYNTFNYSAWTSLSGGVGPRILSIRYNIYNPQSYGPNVVDGQFLLNGTGILM